VSETIHLSSLLAARRQEILERWTQRIGREHPDKELSRGELWDHLPRYFDEMLAALGAEDGACGETPPSEGDTASTAHGTQRLRVGFDLGEVIREYEILTECILDEVDRVGGRLSTRHVRRVLRILNSGRVEAVSAYAERRDADVARSHAQHVAFVAHELRSPLMAAFLTAVALRKGAQPADEWAFGLLTRNLTTLRELIDQVLMADRLAAHVPLTREPLDLRALIDEVVSETQVGAKQRHIELLVAAPDTLPFSGDVRLLRSAIGNVLSNAVKFTQEGDTITLRAERHPNRVLIEIEDGCGGLPEGNAAELFEPFVQRGDNRSGFGLGLAIVKQAIEAHHGRVAVRNIPGKGCVFSLELPCEDD